MPLFQTSVLKKHLAELDAAKVQAAFTVFQSHFADPAKQENIRNAKEEQYQEGFLRELFVDALGYTLNPSPDYNLTTEFKNQTDAKKADGAIMAGGAAIGVIELKGANTTDFKKIEEQAFRYKNNQKGCRYVVTSNFERLRFYIDDATDYEEWDLFNLTPERFALLYLCLAKTHLLAHIPLTIKENSVAQEENVTKKLYADYRDFKRNLFADLRARNPETDPLLLYKKTQKLLDRLLFIFFAEDRGLLPPNSIHEVLMQWQELRDKYDEPVSLYGRFRKYFGYMNTGHQGQKHEIFGYNGGLFAPDDTLDQLKVGDTVLFNGAMALTRYDFVSEVDVNILGHIFEHSLNEIEEVQAELEGRAVDKGKTKRKKDGVFYTPKYITQYIVENTVGALCRQKQAELGLRDEDYATFRKDKSQRKQLHERLQTYRQWLLGITILDPACGSGAFLNQAFNFLIDEHARLDRLQANLFGDALTLTDVDLAILENNLYGVDLNEESVEIAQLALWLRTAKKGRRLSALSHNLRRGNSLIDDPNVAGDAAFDWQKAFPEVFAKGGFDVVVGNPPYVNIVNIDNVIVRDFLMNNYSTARNKYDLYGFFVEKSQELVKQGRVVGLIIPNSWLGTDSFYLLRSFFIKTVEVIEIVNLPLGTFSDATVTPLIVIYSNQHADSHHLIKVTDGTDKYFIQRAYKVAYSDIASTKPLSFSFEKKLEFRNPTILLEEIVEFSLGVKTSDDDRFVFNYKKDSDCRPMIRGRNIGKYSIEYQGEFLWYKPELIKQKAGGRPRVLEHFLRKKICIQDVAKFITAAIDDDHYLVNDTVNIIYATKSEYSFEFIVGLLNSKLISRWFELTFPEGLHIKINQLGQIPIPVIFQSEFIEKNVKDITFLKKHLHTLTTRFLALLTAKYPSLQPTKKLESWPDMTFADFLKEVKKQKIAWSLREESEWLEHFTAEQAAALALQQEIEKTDREIDRMVYELYGLTEAEIALVEGK